jgi:uncharacterized protein (DUF1800 family)
MNTVSDVWLPYEPCNAAPWNRKRVVQLHRRAGFAANWAEVERDLVDGPRAAIDRFVKPKPDREHAENFEAMARTIGDAAAASNSPNRLKAWWLYRMLFSPDPLGERLTLMWHNHFATSNRKVQDLVLMREQNDVIRQHARDPFGQLLAAVVKHPAMLLWLDADSNRKGKANENLAREMLELFTLGIGHYKEADVQSAARALTGWAVVDGHFDFRAARHDSESKTFLGTTGPLTGEDLLLIVTKNPATAKHVARRVCGTFLGETKVDDGALNALADGLHERNLDTTWAVETVLRSQLFFSTAALDNRVAGPVEWAVGAVRALELLDPPPSTLLVAEWTTRMGQDLFYPPNVGGWSEGRAWLGSQSIVARANFAAALVEGQLWYPRRETDLWRLVKQHGKTNQLDAAVTWFAELIWGEVKHDSIAEIVAAAGPAKIEARLPTAIALLLARPESQLS